MRMRLMWQRIIQAVVGGAVLSSCLWIGWLLFRTQISLALDEASQSELVDEPSLKQRRVLDPLAGTGAPLAEKEFRIVVCAKVADEAAYLLEWIEFHRLQGIDKFVLFVDNTDRTPRGIQAASQVHLVPELYSSVVGPGLVDVIPALSLIPDAADALLLHFNDTPMIAHRLHQATLLSYCAEKFRERADWLLHIDVDEFLYASQPNTTLWDFLNGRHNASMFTRGKRISPLRTLGYAIQPTLMGTTGRVFCPHTLLALDAASGRVEVFYDPRDSLRYHEEPLFSYSREEATGLVRRYLNSSLPRSEALINLLEQQVVFDPRHGQHLERMIGTQQIIADLRNKQSVAADIEALLQTIYTPELMPLFPKGTKSELRLQKEGLPSDDDDLSPEIRNAWLTQLETAWMEYFPLVGEEEIYRQPDHGSLGEKSQSILSGLIPACVNQTCPRKLRYPGWLTGLGKSIYRTNAMRLSPQSRRTKRLRGCAKPWVHYCSHRLFSGYAPKVYPQDGLRLDHHQFRSLEKRTTALPRWRGGPVGHARHPDFEPWLQYLSLHPDETTRSLMEEVRRRIREVFHPIPKFFSYEFVDEEPARVVPADIMTRCSAIELLSRRQVPCPTEWPYVQNPTQNGLPYQYCSAVARPAATDEHVWAQTLISTLTGKADWKELHQRVRLCPGWPDMRCCDSEPDAADLQRWLHDLEKCGISDPAADMAKREKKGDTK